MSAFSTRADCVSSFAFLHNLARLQTLELNFQILFAIQGSLPLTVHDQQYDALGSTFIYMVYISYIPCKLCDVDASHACELARFWDVLAGG